jgi:hypothetical protein
MPGISALTPPARPPQADNILAITKAAGIAVEPYWPGLFAKLFAKKSLGDLITNVGAGGERLRLCSVCGRQRAMQPQGCSSRSRWPPGRLRPPRLVAALSCASSTSLAPSALAGGSQAAQQNTDCGAGLWGRGGCRSVRLWPAAPQLSEYGCIIQGWPTRRAPGRTSSGPAAGHRSPVAP